MRTSPSTTLRRPLEEGRAEQQPSRVALEQTFSTSFLADRILGELRLPPKREGARVVDVGAGGSNLSYLLRQQGVDAYAVDPRFGQDMQLLQNNIRERLGVVAERLIDPDSLTERVRAWLIKNLPGADPHNSFSQLALQQMLADQQRNPDNYVRGCADNLPVDPGSCDLAYSLEAVSEFMMDDPDQLQAAVKGMLRAVKPGGKVQICPWPDPEVPMLWWTPDQRRNARLIRRNLLGVRRWDTIPSRNGVCQLVITKS